MNNQKEMRKLMGLRVYERECFGPSCKKTVLIAGPYVTPVFCDNDDCIKEWTKRNIEAFIKNEGKLVFGPRPIEQ